MSGGQRETDAAAIETERVRAEYRRRSREVPADLYAAWRAETQLWLAGRARVAVRMLHDAGVFPRAGTACLEIGCGSLGWFAELLSWGLRETDLHGIDLDESRVNVAREAFPAAEILVGSAARLPWQTETFGLVVCSTLFTSILDREVRTMAAREVVRALAPGGALLWYDFAMNNPRNPHVRKVGRREIRELWPDLRGDVRRVSLAPPLARWLAPRSWLLATAVETIPFLRTHLLAVLKKV